MKNAMIIKRIERKNINEIKRILGDYFDYLKKYFEAILLVSFDYKVFVTRRAYVLYKIFEYVLYTDEREKNLSLTEQDFMKKISENGSIINTHSLYQLLDKKEINLSNKRIMIIDDIIINGRTIGQVCNDLIFYGKISTENPEKNIEVWSLVCNENAHFLDKIKKYFNKDVIEYVTEQFWKSLSNKITGAVITSMTGYVSYVNSYMADISLADKIKSDSIRTIENKNRKFSDCGVTSFVCFFDDELKFNKKYKFTSCIRLYEKDNKLTIIPYVFLPSLKKDKVYDYCSEVLNAFGKEIPSFLRKENCKGNFNSVALYKWTVNELSRSLLCNYNTKPLLICSESYLESSSFEKNEETNTDVADFNIGETLSSGIKSEKIDECTQVLKNVVFPDNPNTEGYNTQDTDVINILKIYLTKMKEKDDERAAKKMNRCIGVRFEDIREILDDSKFEDDHIYAAMINLWDSGIASYNIEQVNSKDGNSQIIGGFLRHGEQIYRTLYEMNSDVFNVFREFYLVTYETSMSKIKEMAAYFDDEYGSKKFSKFFEKIDNATYFSDIWAMDTDFSEADSIVKNPKKEVAWYVKNKYFS